MKTSILLPILTFFAPVLLTQADPGPIIGIAVPAQPITLEISTGGHSPNLITISSDLSNWQNYLNVYSKVPFFRLVDLTAADGGGARRFYKARVQEAQSTSEMRRLWIGLGLTNYQFRLTQTCFCTVKILGGTVTVKNGKVVAVTDASGFDGLPNPNLDLSQFKSVEDLFDLIQNDSLNADVFAVAFDPAQFFPTLIQIDYVAQAVDDEVTYQASDVKAVGP